MLRDNKTPDGFTLAEGKTSATFAKIDIGSKVSHSYVLSVTTAKEVLGFDPATATYKADADGEEQVSAEGQMEPRAAVMCRQVQTAWCPVKPQHGSAWWWQEHCSQGEYCPDVQLQQKGGLYHHCALPSRHQHQHWSSCCRRYMVRAEGVTEANGKCLARCSRDATCISPSSGLA